MNETIEQSELDEQWTASQEKPWTDQTRKAILNNIPGIVLSVGILVAGSILLVLGSIWSVLLIGLGLIIVAGVIVGGGPGPPRTLGDLISDVEEIDEEKERETREKAPTES